ncbi:MAG: hypothetical protein U0401_30105 [Anaerolineae bacterium]
MHNRLGLGGHFLIINIGDGYIKGKLLAGNTLGDVGVKFKGKTAFGAGYAFTLANLLAIDAVIVVRSLRVKS